MRNFKKTFKLLDVVAEEQAQVFKDEITDLTPFIYDKTNDKPAKKAKKPEMYEYEKPGRNGKGNKETDKGKNGKKGKNDLNNQITIIEVLRPTITANFDRVVLFKDKAIVQGSISKNVILKFNDGSMSQTTITTNFSKAVELPGLTTTVTIGKFNRAAITNNVIEIGNDNTGSTAGIDVQIYVKNLTSQEILLDSFTLDEKIVLDFIIKISKFKQQDIEIPAPAKTFEFKNAVDC